MKLFIASVIILFGVVFFLFALFPSNMSVSRIERINVRGDSVVKEIADLGTWTTWNELIRGGQQGHAVTTFAGQPDSNRLVSGKLTVLILKRSSGSIVTRWQDASGRSFLGEFILTQSGGQTILEWRLEFHLRWYPWEKLASMFYDKQLGPLMEQSLLNLRKVLERS